MLITLPEYGLYKEIESMDEGLEVLDNLKIFNPHMKEAVNFIIFIFRNPPLSLNRANI